MKNFNYELVHEVENFDYSNEQLYDDLYQLTNEDNIIKLAKEFEHLKNNNIDINRVNNNGQTVLMLAIKHENTIMIELLLQENADIDFQDKKGNTALIMASQNKLSDVVEKILKYGANPKIQNFVGQDALYFSMKNMHLDVISLLEDHGAGIEGISPLKATVFEEEKAKEIVSIISNELNDKNSIINFLIYALDCNYIYELNLDYYIRNNPNFLVSFKPGRDQRFEEVIVQLYKKIHEEYLNLLNINDGSKKNIRNKIYDLLMHRYELGKYENSNFIEPSSVDGSDRYIETLYISEENYNAEVAIYKDYLVLKTTNTKKELTSFMYKKEKESFINQDRGELIITRTSIIEKAKNGGQRISDYKKINEIEHNPQLLSKLLQKFSDSDKLSYTNHEWDEDTPPYNDFMNNLKSGWSDIKDQLNVLLEEKVFEDIEKFLFEKNLGKKDSDGNLISWGDEITIGWSSKEIIEEIANGTKPHLIEIDSLKNRKVKRFKDVVEIFKNYFVVKNNIKKRFTKLRKENDYKIKLNIDSLGETNIDKFFTDVNRLENALRIILAEMDERYEDAHGNVFKDVKIEIEEKIIKNQNITELKIIHIGSESNQSRERLLDTINRSKGFKSIYKNLKSVCDWSIDTKCSDGKRYKIDYLYPEIDKDKPHWDEITDTIEGFTHRLRFYR